MAICSAEFETGVDGVGLSTSDAGSPSRWTNILTASGSAAVYDNDHVHNGSLACKVSGGSPSANACFEWESEFLGTQAGTHYGRAYMYWVTFQSTTMKNILYLSAGSNRGQIQINSTGKVVLYDSAATAQYTSSTSVNTNGWTRIEWKIIQSATVGDIQCRIYLSPNSTTPDEDFGGTAGNLNMSASCNECRIGYAGGGGTNQAAYWLDSVAIGGSSWFGPHGTFSAGDDSSINELNFFRGAEILPGLKNG